MLAGFLVSFQEDSNCVFWALHEGDNLVDMRVLRLGDHIVSDQIARQHGIHAEQARVAVGECLTSGGDATVEREELPPALDALGCLDVLDEGGHLGCAMRARPSAA